MTPQHVYPTSLEAPDIAHSENAPLSDPEASVTWSRDRRIDGCCLCSAGICLQKVETWSSGQEIVIHGLPLH